MYMYIPVVDFGVGVKDWIILESHQVEMEDWWQLEEYHSLLGFLGEGERYSLRGEGRGKRGKEGGRGNH